jgi:hypothetical protein
MQSAATTILVGLPYTSTLQPMKLEMQLRNGSTKGAKKRVFRAAVSFYKSLGGQYQGNVSATWDAIFSRSTTDPMDDSPEVFSGDKEFSVSGNYSRDGLITIRQNQPLPLTVLAIVPVWESTSN